jgi:hypothetical protein
MFHKCTCNIGFYLEVIKLAWYVQYSFLRYCYHSEWDNLSVDSPTVLGCYPHNTWLINTQHLPVTHTTRGCYTHNTWLLHTQHLAVTHTTLGCYTHSTWLLHTQHLAVTHTTLGCYPHNTWLLPTQHLAVTHTALRCYPHNTSLLHTQHLAVTHTTLGCYTHNLFSLCVFPSHFLQSIKISLTISALHLKYSALISFLFKFNTIFNSSSTICSEVVLTLLVIRENSNYVTYTNSTHVS